jgi:hypothetical protein
MNDINIWDIDGCFVPLINLTSNSAENAERIKKLPKDEKFCKFASTREGTNYIFTGRKLSLIGTETLDLLSTIFDNFSVDFYPEDLGYEPLSIYQDWKVGNIIKLIKNCSDIEDLGTISIYDDDREICKELNNRLLQLPELLLKFKIEVNEVEPTINDEI